MIENKQEFRRCLRNVPCEVNGGRISRLISGHPWFIEARVIMAFYPMQDEPDILPLLREILNSGKTLLLPKCRDNGIMKPHFVLDLALLRRDSYGILEPEEGRCPLYEGNIDLILAPGLAFDRFGNRMGRGKGYYDRFLSQHKAKTMGVCSRLVEHIPVTALDVPVDIVVTDQQIYDGLEAVACSEKE